MSEAYLQRGNRALEAELAKRTAAVNAAFLLPHLRSGMRVLDVGSGPGSITLGLAEAVAPGEVVGVDLQDTMVEAARSRADERGLPNIRFERADAYALPFADDSFDAVFSHHVLMHLADPPRALREMRRVLRAGGIVGLRDADITTTVRSPVTPPWDRFLELRRRAFEYQGSDLALARKHRQLLGEAGFRRTESNARIDSAGSIEPARAQATWLKSQVTGFRNKWVGERWVTQVEVDEIVADIEAWAERSDAMYFMVFCETLGWV